MNAQQLKNSILQEAIQGRLVPQAPTDEPASILLERIRAEKERLVKEGKLKKKDLEVNPISEDEIPFDIPDSWEWVRIKSIFSMQAGKNVTASDIKEEKSEKYPYLCYGGNGIRGYVAKYNTTGCFPLVGRQGALCGNVNIAEGNFWATEHAVVTNGFGLTEIMWQYYFLTALNLNNLATATAQPGLAVSNVIESLIPLPPLAEQKRIVAKIEELLPKVEEYGKAQEALDKLNAELPDRLKKSVLQEAIEGRLVPQDPNDEPASVLLAKIRQEKEQLVKEGKLKKKDLEVKPISEDEIPFEIPENWEWVRLRDVLSVKSGEFLNVRSLNEELNYPVYGGNGINGAYDKYNVESDTLIIGRVGFYCGSIHKTFSKAWVTDNALIVTFSKNNLYVDYLQYVLGWLNIRTTSNSTAQPVVSGKGIYPLLFPLPPLAEQHRIVEKLEQLLGEINKLKK